MTTTAGIALVPRDGIFCKDGRGWFTSSSGRGHGLDWPWPSTLLGAVRTAWGLEQEAKLDRCLQPSEWRDKTAALALRRSLVLRRAYGEKWISSHRVWTVPSDALWLEGEQHVCRLDPGPPQLPTLGQDDDPAREALWVPQIADARKPIPSPRWWSEEYFVEWLCGKQISITNRRGQLKTLRRVQSHVAINAQTFTAEEGVLYCHDVIETIENKGEWAVGVEIVFRNTDIPKELTNGISTLGADGRIVQLEELSPTIFEIPEKLRDAFKRGTQGLKLVVATPGCFAGGWLPDEFSRCGREIKGRLPAVDAEVVLRAAFVSRPVHISGWDMAACKPKPTSRMVPAGSVYFFERVDAKPFGEKDAKNLWLSALGSRTEEGFGLVVPGIWKPMRLG